MHCIDNIYILPVLLSDYRLKVNSFNSFNCSGCSDAGIETGGQITESITYPTGEPLYGYLCTGEFLDPLESYL